MSGIDIDKAIATAVKPEKFTLEQTSPYKAQKLGGQK